MAAPWLIAAACGAALLAWWLAQAPLAPKSPAENVAAPRQQSPATSGRSEGRALAQASNPAEATAIELVDVVSVSRGTPRAVLRINGGPAQSFGWGDVVSVGVRLARIAPNGVELQRGGTIEILALARTAVEPSGPMVVAQVATQGQDADTSSVIAYPADQAPPTSTAIERAIQRSTAH